MQPRGWKRARNFSSADYRFLMFSVGVSHEKSNPHLYIHLRYTSEHHSFQPPDLENVISSTISSNVFEYIYTLTRSKWHTRNDGKTARKSSPHIKPYITGHEFPQVTSHLIQLIALFSHFSWFFFPLFSFTLHSAHHSHPTTSVTEKTVFPSYYFPRPENLSAKVYICGGFEWRVRSQRMCSYNV